MSSRSSGGDGCLGCLIYIFIFIGLVFCCGSCIQHEEDVKQDAYTEFIRTSESIDSSNEHATEEEGSVNTSGVINSADDSTIYVSYDTSSPSNLDKQLAPKLVDYDGIYYLIYKDYATVFGLKDVLKTKVSIPSEVAGLPVKGVNKYAFYDEDEIISIKLPESIEEIGTFAFCQCRKLESINIPKKITTIHTATFSLCESLKKIDVPDGVTVIETSGFSNTKLSSIDIHNVTYLGDSAFSNCGYLKSVTLSPEITRFGQRTFAGCGFEKFTVPDGVAEIGKQCFEYCGSLKSINLPESLQVIGDKSFYFCSKLEAITIPSKVQSLDKTMFFACDKLKVIYVPTTCKLPKGSKFQNTEGRIEFY